LGHVRPRTGVSRFATFEGVLPQHVGPGVALVPDALFGVRTDPNEPRGFVGQPPAAIKKNLYFEKKVLHGTLPTV